MCESNGLSVSENVINPCGAFKELALRIIRLKEGLATCV